MSPSKTSLLFARAARNAAEVLPRIARVAGVLAFAYALVFAWTAWRARADAREALFGIGAEMMRLAGANRHDAPRTLVLNGQRIWLATASTDRGVHEVLDLYEQKCKAHDGSLLVDREGLPESALRALDDTKLDTTMRFETAERGTVACLDTGSDEQSLEQMAARLRAFASSADLHDVGDLRYAFVERTRGSTHVVTFWTEGSFRFREAFPREGDAPGRDVPNLPRPPGSRRIFSAWEETEPQTMTIYSSATGGKMELKRFYERELPTRGWRVLEPDESRSPRPRGVDGLVLEAELGDASVFLVLDEGRDGRGNATVFASR